ncbi:MAG: heavy metal translocating P-type ATPase [Anaerolineae bacterium]
MPQDTETQTSSQALELRIKGMDCADCAVTLEQGVSRLTGVDSCEVIFTTGQMKVRGTASPDEIAQRVEALGYAVAAPDDPADEQAAIDYSGARGLFRYLLGRTDSRTALIGLALLLVSFGAGLAGLPERLSAALHIGIAAFSGLPIMRTALRELRYSRKVTINLLMTIAVIGAIAIGETGEAATVIVLFAIGEALEGYAGERARYSLRSLLDLVPHEATVLQQCMDYEAHLGQDGYEGGPCPVCGTHEARVPVETLQVSDRIVVKPGERIPMDGVVISGASSVNQAPITGESIPVEKQAGDGVFAGTINGSGVLEVEVTRLAADNTLSRIIHLVQEAQASRAPTQRFIDRFAQWYTPGVVVLALLVALVPPLFGAPFFDTPEQRGWLYRALALLIIACPCALVISTPVTIVSGLTSAARQGILIKGGGPLEALAGIRAIALDKTGTLTEGRPVLRAARSVYCETGTDHLACDPCRDLLALAAAVEQRSEHPLAQAILDAANARDLANRYPAARDVKTLTGRGVHGEVNGAAVTIGSHAYFDATYPHSPDLCAQVNSYEQAGQTTMLLARDDAVVGMFSVADQPRASTREALEDLKGLHPTPRTIMLTGDNPATAQAIARQVGVDDVRAGLLPEDKLAAIHEIEAAHGPTAMIGDGINDAPALAAASIGIAMGGAGTDQAMETADVVLMRDDLRLVPRAIRLSRRTLQRVRENIGLSLGIKLLFLALTLAGWASLWLAVFADVGASLIVTANGLRLLRSRIE